MKKQAIYNTWADIVLAMLATGGYRLEKVFQHFELLQEYGLTDPRKISCMDPESIARNLVASGYNRGPILTGMYTERLLSLGKLSDQAEENERILAEGTKEQITVLLKDIKGIGPVVIRNFLELRESYLK